MGRVPQREYPENDHSKDPGRSCMSILPRRVWGSGGGGLLLNAIGQSSQRPAQIQGEGTETLPLHGRSAKTFVAH